MKLVFVAGVTCLGLAGCAAAPAIQLQTPSIEAQQIFAQSKSVVESVVVAGPYTKAKEIAYEKPIVGGTTVKVSDVQLNDILTAVAQRAGFTVAFAEGTSPTKKVSFALNNAKDTVAFHEIAEAAGYVAVINQKLKTITVSKTGTYVFRLFGNKATEDAIKSLSGNATVAIDRNSKTIAIQGDANQLRRARDFVQAMYDEWKKQVRVELTAVEVSPYTTGVIDKRLQTILGENDGIRVESENYSTDATKRIASKIAEIGYTRVAHRESVIIKKGERADISLPQKDSKERADIYQVEITDVGRRVGVALKRDDVQISSAVVQPGRIYIAKSESYADKAVYLIYAIVVDNEIDNEDVLVGESM